MIRLKTINVDGMETERTFESVSEILKTVGMKSTEQIFQVEMMKYWSWLLMGSLFLRRGILREWFMSWKSYSGKGCRYKERCIRIHLKRQALDECKVSLKEKGCQWMAAFFFWRYSMAEQAASGRFSCVNTEKCPYFVITSCRIWFLTIIS